jgi:enterochelin esterase-like enzyme
MMSVPANAVRSERRTLSSVFLDRSVVIDSYNFGLSEKAHAASLLLINDGQDLCKMPFQELLAKVLQGTTLKPLLVVGIHCSEDRIQEYGMIHSVDYKGRGSKASLYRSFILEELIPYLESFQQVDRFDEIAMAGFSLGGLSAFDLVWNEPGIFSKVGVFSGSFWWRSVDQSHRSYTEAGSRLMHVQVRNGSFQPRLKFFFACGDSDEAEDRNGNGVIDAIDDTIDLMRELLAKGYLEGRDFHYEQLSGGRHDVATWALAFPAFLRWGWSLK